MAHSYDTQAFRDRYRAAIHALYNPWLHALFVLAYGISCLTIWLSSVHNITPQQWLLIPLTLIFFSWGEYHVHKKLGHHKTRFGRMFYRRHTGDHHSFFIETQMPYEQRRDWRVILFPAWLIVLYSLPLWAIWWFGTDINANIAALFCSSMLIGYLSYEVLHSCQHLPESNPITRLPWIRQMRQLHALHHRRDLMQSHNFGIVHPLWDWIYGTLYWENKPNPTAPPQ